MSTIKIGFASYTLEQWLLLKACADDREDLDRTYADWEKNREKTIARLRGEGSDVVLVPMDVGEIVKWCHSNNEPNNMRNRAQICRDKLDAMGRQAGV